MSTESGDPAWARDHRACFQVGALIEMRGHEKLQVGFTVDLYATLPTDKAPGVERREESHGIWEHLRAIVESLIPAEGAAARVEIEPRRTTAYLRPENGMEPEIGLRARVFHRDEYFKVVTAGERERLSEVERRLTGMGLRPDHW
jgi:hypothetical protein